MPSTHTDLIGRNLCGGALAMLSSTYGWFKAGGGDHRRIIHRRPRLRAQRMNPGVGALAARRLGALPPDMPQPNVDLVMLRSVDSVVMDGVQETTDPGYAIVPCMKHGEGGVPLPDSPIHLSSNKPRRKEMASVPGPQKDPYDLNKLVEAIVQECTKSPQEPTLEYLEDLMREGVILIAEFTDDISSFIGVSYDERDKTYRANLWIPRSSQWGGKQLFTGTFHTARMATFGRELLILKCLMCGVRWSSSHTLHFPLREYLRELRKPRVMAMTDYRQYRMYLIREASDGAVYSHVDGFNGVFWNNYDEQYEAHVWNSEKGEYSQGKLPIEGRRPSFTAKFERKAEAVIAHDKEAIRIGAWRDQKLNNPVTNYIDDLMSSPFVQEYIQRMLGHTNSSSPSQLVAAEGSGILQTKV